VGEGEGCLKSIFQHIPVFHFKFTHDSLMYGDNDALITGIINIVITV
jgi:hypothetical protein